jgi:hypothetical protein
MSPPTDASPQRRGTPPVPPPQVEHTHWSLALIGFYLSCAGVALGATFAAAGYAFFGSTGWLVFGSIMSGVCCVTCFLTLRAARRPPAERDRSRPPQ